MTGCLELASKYLVKSIVFPTLGTGSLGYPHKDAAKAMYKGICDFEERNPNTSISCITIVVYDADSKCKAIQQVSYKNMHVQ